MKQKRRQNKKHKLQYSNNRKKRKTELNKSHSVTNEWNDGYVN